MQMSVLDYETSAKHSLFDFVSALIFLLLDWNLGDNSALGISRFYFSSI